MQVAGGLFAANAPNQSSMHADAGDEGAAADAAATLVACVVAKQPPATEASYVKPNRLPICEKAAEAKSLGVAASTMHTAKVYAA